MRKFSGVVFLCLLSFCVLRLGAAALVQHHGNNSTAVSNQLTIPINVSQAGNLLAVGAMGSLGDSVVSIADNASPPNTYTQVPGSRRATGAGRWVEIWYSTTGNSGATAVLITVHAVNNTPKRGEVWEASGVDLLNPLDVNGVAGGSTTGSLDTGPSITTTNANDLLLAIARTNSGIVSQNDATFTLDDVTSGGNGASHAITTAAGTFTPVWNDGASTEFIGSVAAFRSSSAPPPPLPTAPVLTSPANTATSVLIPTQLNWNASTNATSYDVYFATVTPPVTRVANTVLTHYTPAITAAGVTYFWQVVAKNSAGTASSPIWSFTTAPVPPPPPPSQTFTSGNVICVMANTLGILSVACSVNGIPVYSSTSVAPGTLLATEIAGGQITIIATPVAGGMWKWQETDTLEVLQTGVL